MRTCPACGAENPEGFRFCGSCGSSLEAGPAAPLEERKVVTVLFADVVGFTARSERLDPEDVRATLSPYFARLRSEIEHHGGTVEKFIGDAVMALFGAPVAHEDDPERAVRAALAIRDAIAEMNERDPELDLHVRIGINTGEVLVTLGARPDQGEGMAAGDVVNTAARLQSAAPVDGILVGEPTYRATERAIELVEAAPVEAKGKADPVPAWEVGQARSRLGVDVARSAATPLVGRVREVSILRDSLDRVREQRSPQLVTLVGEPGIGKSRLVYELLNVVAATPGLITWRQGRCLPYGEGVSFWAIGEMVKSQAGILETDPDEEAAAKLGAAVRDLLPDDDDAMWVEAHVRPLVGLASARAAHGEALDEAFAAWRRFLEALAERRPTVLVFEDLHWADDGLLDFIEHLVDWASGVPLLVVCTSRPELLARRAGWGGGTSNATTIALTPLTEEETARLFQQLLDRPVLSAELQSALLSRAGGNPLYAEEFARIAADRGGETALDELPGSLHGIIAARLDALDPVDKALLQDAAVVGKVFWVGAVTALGAVDRAEADRRMHLLERRQFVRRERRPSVAGELEYAFWHPLVRDVAYSQIPRAARADKHRAAAEWIGSLSDRLEDRAELVAYHYTSALRLVRAAGQDTRPLEEPAWIALSAAGDRALSLSSFAAAERHYGGALELVPEEHPDRPAMLLRHARVLWIRERGGSAQLAEARDGLLAAGDMESAAEAEIMLGDIEWGEGRGGPALEHFRRARELVADRGASTSKAWVFAHLSRFHMLADRTEEAIEAGREALAMAEPLGLQDLRSHVLNNIGTARTQAGDVGGLADLEESIALAERINSPSDLARGRINLAVMRFLLGELREARRLHEGAMETARRYGFRQGERWSLPELAQAAYHAGEWDAALRLADRFLAEVEAGAPHYSEHEARLARSPIRLARGDTDGALDDSTKALAEARGAQDPQALHPSLADHARVLLLSGRTREAGSLVDELLELVTDRPAGLLWSLWFLPAAVVLEAAGRADELLSVADRMGPLETPWIEAGRAYLAGDLAGAADVLDRIGSLPDAAFARLRAGERLASEGRTAESNAQLQRALAFYRGVGAVRFVAEGEELLAASA